jgi:hypothetical protein
MRHALAYVLLLLIALPIAAVVTLLALPLWNLIETRFGIESVGHSGPADWCFEVTYALFVAVGVVVELVRKCNVRRSGKRRTNDNRQSA